MIEVWMMNCKWYSKSTMLIDTINYITIVWTSISLRARSVWRRRQRRRKRRSRRITFYSFIFTFYHNFVIFYEFSKESLVIYKLKIVCIYLKLELLVYYLCLFNLDIFYFIHDIYIQYLSKSFYKYSLKIKNFQFFY